MKIRRNIYTGLLSLAALLTTGSCKSDTGHNADTAITALQRGKPVDVDKINFEKANLDKLFARLAYMKNFKLGEATMKYTKDKPLVISRYLLYNITEPRIVNRYTKRETETITKGQLYADTVMIDRSVPLIGLKDADMRPLLYWGDKDMVFNQVFTSSTKKNKLIRLRLESNELKGVTEQTYNKLFDFLKAKYKNGTLKVEPQDDRPNSYQWRTADRVIYISFNKHGELAYITVMMAFINADTKSFLPEFGH